MAPIPMYVGTYTAYKGLPGAKSEGICAPLAFPPREPAPSPSPAPHFSPLP